MKHRPPVRTPDEVDGFAAIFWRYVSRQEDRDACWVWCGWTTPKGYGKVQLDDGRWVGAHRVAYILERGEIGEGLTLDHLCRTPPCVNPWHLEPVTNAENIRRGIRPQQRRARLAAMSIGRACGYRKSRGPRPPRPPQSHCRLGHPMSADNVRLMPSKKLGTARLCRECCRIRERRRGSRAEYAKIKRKRKSLKLQGISKLPSSVRKCAGTRSAQVGDMWSSEVAREHGQNGG
jgi:hypothetical protein